jgi:hypothetical protein
MVANGSTAGTDADWWLSLFAAMTRISLLTAMAAVLGVALATIGRNTAFALVAIFAWVAAIESLVRGIEPSLQQYLWSENIAIVFTWGQLGSEDFARSPALALATVALYTGVIVAISALTFRSRDIAVAT